MRLDKNNRPFPLHPLVKLNDMWSSYNYLVSCLDDDDPEIEKLFDDLYGMTTKTGDFDEIPSEILDLVYERHEDPNNLYGLINSLYEYWEIEMTLYKSLRKMEKIVSKEFDREYFIFRGSRDLTEDTCEYPMEMLKKIFKINVKELV